MMLNETLSFGVSECPIVRPEGIYYGGRKVISLGLGEQQRANPLPTGRYWVDVFTPQEAAFQSWLQKNKANVTVVTTETFPGETHWFGADDPGRTWRLFDVKTPVTWEGPGFPTIADAGTKNSADTAQRPAPEPDAVDQITHWGSSASAATKTALIVGGVVVAVIVIAGIAYYAPPRRQDQKPDPEPRLEPRRA